jgi:aryl-alcohol dehydrogenase-like predicted oxidoreductase
VEKTGTSWVLRASPEEVMRDVDYALKELGTDYLDTIVLCRVPKDRPIEEVVHSMKAVVDAGTVRHGRAGAELRVDNTQCVQYSGKARNIGLSEASASTIRRAHAVYPLHCIEQEWSLWARDIEEDIVPTCRELGERLTEGFAVHC